MLFSFLGAWYQNEAATREAKANQTRAYQQMEYQKFLRRKEQDEMLAKMPRVAGATIVPNVKRKGK